MKSAQRFGPQVLRGLDLYGVHSLSVLHHKVYFGPGVVSLPVEWGQLAIRSKFLTDKLFGQRALKFLEYGISLKYSLVIKAGHSPQQADIHQK